MRDALQEAYELAALTQDSVGEFDYDQQKRAHQLGADYNKANQQANHDKGVFEKGISDDEKRLRRGRAAMSVGRLKQDARDAISESDSQWRRWRKAMVRELLSRAALIEKEPHQSTPSWFVRKPKRQSGYTPALLRLLRDMHAQGYPRPKAREVIEQWRDNMPQEVAKVLADSIDYYDARGDTKPASLKAITATIKRLTEHDPE